MLDEDFRISYIKEVEGLFTLGEDQNRECLMLNQKINRCRIYSVRPNQCSSYPFWPDLLRNQVSWAREATLCPGIDNGPLWTCGEIRKRMLQVA
jgi:Fe-S-cluster containining protein